MGNDSYVTIGRAAFIALLLLNVVLWSRGSYGQPHHNHALQSLGHKISKRSILSLLESKQQYSSYEEGGSECRPIAVPIENQCRVVHDSCPTSDTFLAIQYLKAYFCASPATRPFVFVGLLLWLMFLFTTLGISASDFFCPNLATIANLLNLDENVAGVTFLAFGNGSPDVFATFSALRSNAGSLAIGELLGAASFIVSCVVGSMCIIKPFRVNRGPFLRDASFFMAAVAMLLGILLDGWIYAWEAVLLLLLYLVYVFTVVVGSWWEYRQQKKHQLEARIRSEYAEEGMPPYTDDEPYQDDPTRSLSNAPMPPPSDTSRRRLSSLPRLEFQTQPLNLQVQDSQADSRSPSSSPRLPTMPSFSLVGALEFRSVISSLQQDAAGLTLSAFDSPLTPLTPYPGGHYHGYGHPRSRSRGSIHSVSAQTWDTSSDVPLSDRSPLPPAISLAPDDSDHHTPEVPLIHIDTDSELPIPEISHIPPSPIPDSGSDVGHHIVAEPSQEAGFVLAHACHILFPTLHGFHAKSLLGKTAAILATPAVFALTITLPVVVGPYDSSGYRHEKPSAINDTLVTFEGDESEHLIGEVEEVDGLHFNKWLMALQCTLGPLFCVAVLLKGTTHERWVVLATGLAGLISGVSVAFFADKGDSRGWLFVRCSMGFFVAIVWIMAIADEIINVLQTFGFVFGLSDAIIGLTIFAVGNSLADLVANMSVAVFAPVMGFSACFGGPMLNILFGVGISGSYVIYHTGEPYRLHFSNTLLVSAVGLLALLVTTMIFVPMNGYFLPRKWGVFLICFYVVIMIINVIVEVLGFDS